MINLPFDFRMNLATSPYNVPLEHSTSITSFRMKGVINSVERLDIKKREDTEGEGGRREREGKCCRCIVLLTGRKRKRRVCTERRKGGFPLEKGIKGNRYKAIDRGRSSRSLMAWKNSKSQLTFRHCMSAVVAAATRIPCTLRIGNAHCPVSLSLPLLLYLTFLLLLFYSLSLSFSPSPFLPLSPLFLACAFLSKKLAKRSN